MVPKYLVVQALFVHTEKRFLFLHITVLMEDNIVNLLKHYTIISQNLFDKTASLIINTIQFHTSVMNVVSAGSSCND